MLLIGPYVLDRKNVKPGKGNKFENQFTLAENFLTKCKATSSKSENLTIEKKGPTHSNVAQHNPTKTMMSKQEIADNIRTAMEKYYAENVDVQKFVQTSNRIDLNAGAYQERVPTPSSRDGHEEVGDKDALRTAQQSVSENLRAPAIRKDEEATDSNQSSEDNAIAARAFLSNSSSTLLPTDETVPPEGSDTPPGSDADIRAKTGSSLPATKRKNVEDRNGKPAKNNLNATRRSQKESRSGQKHPKGKTKENNAYACIHLQRYVWSKT